MSSHRISPAPRAQRERRAAGGYALAELLVVAVVVALILGPLLAATTVVTTMQHRTGERSRREAWRSMQDEALVTGVDPGRATGIVRASQTALPNAAAAAVERIDSESLPGATKLRALKAPPAAEAGRAGGAGWEITSGLALPAASASAMPELPVVMAPPVVSPGDGTRVQVLSLTPGSAGASATIPVVASSADGARVRLTAGGGSAAGVGRAMIQASAPHLAAGFRGSAWTEYPGTGGGGEIQETLPDGRIRWTVTDGEGRTRVYEPSAVVSFELGLDLGSPVLVWGASELASGSSVSVDFNAYLAVQKGVVEVKVDWPRSVRELLGADAPSVLPSPACTFAGVTAAQAGDLREFFQTDRSGLWMTDTAVRAEAGALGARTIAAGVWTLHRSAIALDPPELVSNPFLRTSAYEAGAFGFAVPALSGAERLGRVSAQAGALMSTGPTLSLTFSP